jgi:hypothetical protein
MGKSESRRREDLIASRMEEMLGWEEEEFKKALLRLGLKPGDPAFEAAMAIWRDAN